MVSGLPTDLLQEPRTEIVLVHTKENRFKNFVPDDHVDDFESFSIFEGALLEAQSIGRLYIMFEAQ